MAFNLFKNFSLCVKIFILHFFVDFRFLRELFIFVSNFPRNLILVFCFKTIVIL